MKPDLIRIFDLCVEFFTRPDSWCQGGEGRKGERKCANIALYDLPLRVNPDLVTAPIYCKAQSVLWEAINGVEIEGHGRLGTKIIRWNDDASRTQDEVLNAFKKARELVEEMT